MKLTKSWKIYQNRASIFLPTELLKVDKTSGLIATDYVKLVKHMPWTFRKFDTMLKKSAIQILTLRITTPKHE